MALTPHFNFLYREACPVSLTGAGLSENRDEDTTWHMSPAYMLYGDVAH